jgi:hypothetical protein
VPSRQQPHGFRDVEYGGDRRFLCLAMPDTFHNSACGGSARVAAELPNLTFQQRDAVLRGFANRIHFTSPRRNGAAAFMDGSSLNEKAAPFQREAKVLVGRGLLGVNPDD